MLDLVGNPNCWFSHAQAHFNYSYSLASSLRQVIDRFLCDLAHPLCNKLLHNC